jgi:hypothetical protein
MISGIIGIYKGEFDFKDYCMMKAVSLATTILTCGIGRMISGPTKEALKRTFPATFGFFVKKVVISGFAKEVACRAASYAIEKLMGSLINNICTKVTDSIIEKAESALQRQYVKIEKSLNQLYESSYERG